MILAFLIAFFNQFSGINAFLYYAPRIFEIAGLEKSAGLGTDQIQWIPSKGGAPALQDLLAGGVTFFTGSPIEAKALLAAEGAKRLLTYVWFHHLRAT